MTVNLPVEQENAYGQRHNNNSSRPQEKFGGRFNIRDEPSEGAEENGVGFTFKLEKVNPAPFTSRTGWLALIGATDPVS